VTSLTTRTATVADLDDIVGFAAVVIPDTYEPMIGAAYAEQLLADWWSVDRLTADLANDIVLVAVADDDPSRILGFVHLGRWNDEPVMWKLYVAPGHRGQGHGSRLVDAAIEALGPNEQTLLTEHVAANVRAAAFYEREGFAETEVVGDTGDTGPASPVWRRRRLR
jgi:GNAT superfamily N-acetyltransferase